MDPTLARTIDTKIKEFSEPLPSAHREDFTQDMWVRLLAISPQYPPGTGSALTSFLNLTLFRARENWMAHHHMRTRQQAAYEAEQGPEPTGVPADVQLEVQEALRDLEAGLKESGFAEQEVTTVIEGLLDGLTQKEIALALGRTPQGMNYHFKKARIAA